MMFATSKYQRKDHDKDRWEDISEIELLGDLFEFNEGVIPAIQQIIEGKRVLTSKAVYRGNPGQDGALVQTLESADLIVYLFRKHTIISSIFETNRKIFRAA